MSYPFPPLLLWLVHIARNGTRNGTGTGNGKNGFLYIMLCCTHYRGPEPGTRMGPGTKNLQMGSIPIFPVPFPVPVPLVPLTVPCSVNKPLLGRITKW